MSRMIARAIEGREYLYNRNSAHKVSSAGAVAICKALNGAKYQLNPGEVWHIYDCGSYEEEYTSAGFLSFGRRGGNIYEKRA